MPSVYEQDRRALFEIAIVLAFALGAVAGALIIATGLPIATILAGGGALYAIAFVVIALVS